MFVKPPKADMDQHAGDVRFVPKADMAAIGLAIFAPIRFAPFW